MSGREYGDLIDKELSNKLNESFNLEVLKKIDNYIQGPSANDIILDNLQSAFTVFFADSTPNTFTYDLTDSQLYKAALSAAETRVKETEEQLAQDGKELSAAQTPVAQIPVAQTAAQTTKTAAQVAKDAAQINLDYLKTAGHNKNQVTASDYLKNLFPTSASYRELTEIFKVFQITDDITINISASETGNIIPLIERLKGAIYSKYQDKFTTFKDNL